jgi:hypothetical protein
MATVLKFPVMSELRSIDALYEQEQVAGDPLFSAFPLQTKNTHFLRWKQRDFYRGLMQGRGLNNPYPAVTRLGDREFLTKPSAYGEHVVIDEEEITIRANPDTPSAPVNLTDEVNNADQMLVARQFNRARWVGWTLILEGIYKVLNQSGAIVGQDSIGVTQYAGTSWGTPATSTPLADARAVALLSEGTSADFGVGAIGFANRRTVNKALANTNAADLGGKRTIGGGTIKGLDDLNGIFAAEGLFTLKAYHAGYYSDAGSFSTWIPDNVVVVFGSHNGASQIGEMTQTRHADNPNAAPGPFAKIVDTGRDPNADPPRQVRVYRGVNMGPQIWYPGAVVIMRV